VARPIRFGCIVAALAFALACAPSAPPAPSPVEGAAPIWHLGKPVIDSHAHVFPGMVSLARTLEVFDKVGVGKFAVKSGGAVGTPKYQATLAMQRVLGDRMRVFANLDWSGLDDPRWVPTQVALLEQGKKDGIVGIKVFKALGLGVRWADGSLLAADDPRLAPIFEACGRLGLIFAWHIADPRAFFDAVTPQNERYDELKIAEGWSFHGKDYPSFDALMATQERVIAAHPNTVFLLIHFGNNAESLDYVDRLLDTYPNVYTDVSARVPELGRHPPDKVRALFVKHQDRILFGTDFITDGPGNMQLGSVWHVPGEEPDVDDAVEYFTRHWRYFETELAQIEHPTPIQGRWKVDAIKLPPDVQEKFYVTNAEKLIFSGQFPRPYAAPAKVDAR
jgi:hypothetical protein